MKPRITTSSKTASLLQRLQDPKAREIQWLPHWTAQLQQSGDWSDFLARLMELTKHPTIRVRRRAIRLFGRIGPEAGKTAADRLARALLDKSRPIRAQAVSSLIRLGSMAIPAILDIVEEHDAEELLSRVQRLLSRLGNRVGKVLPSLFHDLPDGARCQAAASKLAVLVPGAIDWILFAVDALATDENEIAEHYRLMAFSAAPAEARQGLQEILELLFAASTMGFFSHGYDFDHYLDSVTVTLPLSDEMDSHLEILEKEAVDWYSERRGWSFSDLQELRHNIVLDYRQEFDQQLKNTGAGTLKTYRWHSEGCNLYFDTPDPDLLSDEICRVLDCPIGRRATILAKKRFGPAQRRRLRFRDLLKNLTQFYSEELPAMDSRLGQGEATVHLGARRQRRATADSEKNEHSQNSKASAEQKPAETADPDCLFCSKPLGQAGKLIRRGEAWICEGCIVKLSEQMPDDRRVHLPGAMGQKLKLAGCSFCGSSTPERAPFIAGQGSSICCSCLGLFGRILS